LEAGLSFAVKWDKAGGFIGRDALLAQRQSARAQAADAVQIAITRSAALSHEPIWRGEALVGCIRSGMFAHSLGAAVGLGYVTVPRAACSHMPLPMKSKSQGALPSTASLRPLYDPKNERINVEDLLSWEVRSWAIPL